MLPRPISAAWLAVWSPYKVRDQPARSTIGRRRAPAVESKAGTRKPRQVKVYKNPHTGEVVETKGGNHKTLKEWKAEHGSATVESWLTK